MNAPMDRSTCPLWLQAIVDHSQRELGMAMIDILDDGIARHNQWVQEHHPDTVKAGVIPTLTGNLRETING